MDERVLGHSNKINVEINIEIAFFILSTGNEEDTFSITIFIIRMVKEEKIIMKKNVL